MNYQKKKKIKTILTEGLTKDLINKFLMEQNIFYLEYFQIIYHLYQLKNILNILVAIL